MTKLADVQEVVRRQMNNGLVGDDQLVAFTVGLAEEAGEVLGVLSKTYFDPKKTQNFNHRTTERSSEDAWCKELGDVLWYLAAVANSKGLTLDEIWEKNQEKLVARHGFR